MKYFARLFAAALALAFAAHSTVGAAGHIYERVEYVMGTMLRVSVTAATESSARMAVDTAFAVVRRLDRLLSNYKPDSDISRMAAEAPGAIPVSEESFQFIAETTSWAYATGGALSPAIGPVVALWGFYGDDPEVPDSADLEEMIELCQIDGIRLDSSSGSVQLRRGMQFDPGATGKGFALRAADRVVAECDDVERVFFDFGGQVFYRGEAATKHGVVHPRDDSVLVGTVRFVQGSLATSGDYEKYFEHAGARYAHILDPRTGWPVQGRAAVTVFAPDPFVADVLSTALFVLGPEQGASLLDRLPETGALFAEWRGDSLVFVPAGCWDDLQLR